MPGSRLRYEVRHDLVRLFEELITFTADSGAATTIVEDLTLGAYAGTGVTDATSVLRGSRCYIYAGTGIGQERRITANTQSSGTVTVAPAWTTNPDSTSQAEVHKTFPVAHINAQINRAIADIRQDSGALVSIVPDTSILLAADTFSYTFPSNLRWVERIIMETQESGIYELHNPIARELVRVEKTAQPTSSVDATYTLLLDRDRFPLVAGRRLKIYGAGPVEPLTAATSLLVEGLDSFVLHRAAYYLLSPMARGSSDASKQVWREAQLHWTESENARTRTPYIPPPGSWEVTR